MWNDTSVYFLGQDCTLDSQRVPPWTGNKFILAHTFRLQHNKSSPCLCQIVLTQKQWFYLAWSDTVCFVFCLYVCVCVCVCVCWCEKFKIYRQQLSVLVVVTLKSVFKFLGEWYSSWKRTHWLSMDTQGHLLYVVFLFYSNSFYHIFIQMV